MVIDTGAFNGFTATNRWEMTVTGSQTVRGTVRRPRDRDHLTESEVEELMAAARRRGRHGHRDATMILVAYRHGLRVSELVSLTWSQVDARTRTIWVARLKGSDPARHPIGPTEWQALQFLHRAPTQRHIFVGERGGPISPRGFAQMLDRTAKSIEFPLNVHPHMLRHACGYKLANDGQDTRAIQSYLGHRQIQHTVRYTQLSAERFRGFWSD